MDWERKAMLKGSRARIAIVVGAILAVHLLFSPDTVACDLCPTKGTPLYKELPNAPIVLFGHISQSRLDPSGRGGTSDFHVEALLRDTTGSLKDKKVVVFQRYVPVDAKTKFLVLGELLGGQFDPYRSFLFNSDRVLKYLKEAPDASDPKQAEAVLKYAFPYLNDSEGEIAADAFALWANSTNQAVSKVAAGMDPVKLKNWLLDPKTPPQRLGLYAMLLGSCGSEGDLVLLKKLIEQPDERMANSIDGLLAGYIQRRPDEGWALVRQVLTDPNRPFTQKHATLRMLRFFHSTAGDQHGPRIVEALGILVRNPSLFDLATDQLRLWKLWQHTDAILKLYGTDAARAPMAKRAIVRYALSCPEPAAKSFIAELRKQDPKLVTDVEEDLRSYDEAPIK